MKHAFRFISIVCLAQIFAVTGMRYCPALLPDFGGKGFYGRRVHESMFEAGSKIAGCTVHFVDNIYDNGPILLQKAVAVHENDAPETLDKRVRKQEKVIYPQAIRLFAQDRLRIEGKRVRILE